MKRTTATFNREKAKHIKTSHQAEEIFETILVVQKKRMN